MSDHDFCEHEKILGELISKTEENSRQIESLAQESTRRFESLSEEIRTWRGEQAEEIRTWRKEQDTRIALLERDNYAGKAVIRVLYALFAALAGFLAWAAGKLWG